MKNPVITLMLIFVLFEATDSVLFAQLFEEKVDYYVGLRPNTVVSGDFDNDGDIDLAASPNTPNYGLVTILKNNGDGTFILSDTLLVGYAPNLTMSYVDNDSEIDLVASDWDPPYQMYLILNDGSGNFALTDSFPSYGTQAHLLCAADFDNDDDFDLAVPNSASSNLGIFFNNGDGTFALPPPLFTMGYGPIRAFPGDLDMDGDSDLVVSIAGEGNIKVLLNDGTGDFPVASNYQTGAQPFAHSLADYNGDGCLDVAVPNYESNTLSVMFGNCDGTFGSIVDYPGCHPILAASADIDNDGDIDIAVSNNVCNTISIYRNNGDGTFETAISMNSGNGPIGITANDFNGDGWIDMAVCNFDNLANFSSPGNNVSVFINTQRTIIFPINMKTDKNYLEKSGDSLHITTNFENFYGHDFTTNAIYVSSDNSYTDSIALYDDGIHGDSLANDGLYGGFIPSVSEEEFFSIGISTTDNQTGKYFMSGNLARFTTSGPVLLTNYYFTAQDTTPGAGDLIRCKFKLKNFSDVFTIPNVTAKGQCYDTLITIVSSLLSFGDISPGEENEGSGYLAFKLDENCPNNYSISFSIKIMSEEWEFWQDSIEIVTGINDYFDAISSKYTLEQNYPNPFNPGTRIKYVIGSRQFVTLKIYDVLGNEIETLVDEEKPAGSYVAQFDASNLSSGIYFYKIHAGTYVATRKMLLMK